MIALHLRIGRYVVLWLVLIQCVGCVSTPEVPPICQQIPQRWKSMRRPISIDGAHSYVYRQIGGLKLRLHVLAPSSPGDYPRGAMLLYFGGGWSWGTVDQLYQLANALRLRGMYAILVDYRVLCRDDSTPFDSLEDAQEALVWVHDHAASLGIDSAKIAVGGESSGGQLALMTALADNSTIRPAALVLLEPGIDITQEAQWAHARFGDSIAQMLMTISPYQHVRKDAPPMLIIAAEKDTSAPLSITRQFCDKLLDLGRPCKLVIYPGAEHGFTNPPGYPMTQSHGGKYFAGVLWDIDQFLDGLGYFPDKSP